MTAPAPDQALLGRVSRGYVQTHSEACDPGDPGVLLWLSGCAEIALPGGDLLWGEVLTSKPKSAYSVSEPEVARLGNVCGQSLPGEQPKRGHDSDARPLSETRTIPLTDRGGRKTHKHLTRAQWMCLHARKLVELIFTSRRRDAVGQVRLAPGVSVAAVNAALRDGIRDRLPVAEDNRTIARDGLASFKHVRTMQWDDGRQNHHHNGPEAGEVIE